VYLDCLMYGGPMPMRSWEQIRCAELAEMFPSHDVWIVPRYCGHTVWCSRPKGHPTATINASSADELQAAIAQEIASGTDPSAEASNVVSIARKYS
jgi:hypothetical protein